MKLTFGSLFSGIGGFDLGLERAGMECRWQVEIDKDCGAVLSRHWPGVERFEDITAVNDLPAVDVLCGGFPCQDLSVAGRRAGLAGERSGLFYEFMRLAAQLRPIWLVIENVPGLLSSNGGRDMGTVLGTLGRLGYGYAYRVLDAQYFGVAQRRRRVFIVGHARAERAAAVLFEPESCNGDSAPSREAGERAAYALTAGVRGTGDGHGNAWNSNYVAETLRSHPRPGSNSVGNLTVAATLRSRQHGDGVNPPGRGGEDDANLVVAQSLNTAFHRDATVDTFIVAGTLGTTDLTGNGAEETFLTIAHTLRAEGCDASEDGTGRGTPLVTAFSVRHAERDLNDITHCLQAGTGETGNMLPAALIGPSVRRLTPTECERLQGFPDGWTAGASDSARYRMLGNAVCVPVAHWIAQRIVSAS